LRAKGIMMVSASLQDDDEVAAIHEELLDETSVDELDSTTDEDDAGSEELDSSTTLLSPPSGPELLASSPQAAKNRARAGARSIGNLLYFISVPALKNQSGQSFCGFHTSRT
jgi:hypothetical protein